MFLDYLSTFIVDIPRLFIKIGLADIQKFEGKDVFHPANNASLALFIFCLILGFAIFPYLLGAVSIPRLYCKKVKGLDVYSIGSGKGEIFDVWSCVGKWHGVACFALEAAKVFLCLCMGFFSLGADGAAIAAFFCLLGEMLPIWHKMQGSRGFETAALGLLILSPLTFGILLAIFGIVFVGMRFRTAARLFPTLLYPLIASAFLMSANPTSVLLSVGVVVLMLFSHWKNVREMLDREEPRLEFSLRKRSKEDEE